MSCAKSVAGSTFGQKQQQTQQKHAKNQQQKFTKAAASQTNSSKNHTLTTATSQTVNCSQASPAPSSSKSPTLTSPIATATYMASSNCSSSSFSFESGVVLSGSSGCSSLSNSPTSSSSSNPYLASLGVPTNLPTEGTAAVGNSVCASNASHLDESFSSTSCILNSSLLAAVNGDLEDESKIMSQSLSDTLCSSQNKSDTLQINEDNSGQQQLLLENMNHHHHPQLSVEETTCLNTEDARTLQLAVELTMMNLNQMPSPTPPAAATSSSSPSTTTTTNNFEHLLQQPHRLHSPLDQPYSSSYTSVSNPYHMTTKVFLQTQSQAAAATLLNQKFLSDTSLSNSPTKLNTLPNHNQTLGGTVVTIDDRSKKSQNMTECVPVPSSEHVAEIVGRQGCKIKALRAKTNTYIKTPVRNEEPVFVVTGRKEDVAKAKREILSAAEHFTLIRATRRTNDGISACVAGLGGGLGAGGGHLVSFNKNSLSSATPLPGQVTIQVRVPYRVVGLVVGPKGNTIKHIQHETQTYIVTPSRDKQPIFEVTGMPDNVEMARKQIEAHIATRTGNTLNNSLAIPAPPPPPPPPPAPAGTLNQLSDTIVSTQASLQSLNALNQILNDDLHSEILSSIYKNGIGSALEYSQIGANVTNTTNNRCHNSNPFNCGFVGEINPTVLSVNDIQRRILNAGNSNVNMQLNCTDFINNLIDSNAVSQFTSESNTNFPQLAHNTNAIRNLKSVINTINLLENSSNGDVGTLQQQNCPTTNALLTRSCSSASSTASSSKSFNNGNNPQYWKSVNSSTIPANKTCGNGVVSGNDSLDIDEGIGESPLYSWGLPNALAALTNSYCSPASTSISPTDSLFGEHHVNSQNAVIQNQQYIGSAKAKLLEKLKRSNCWMCQDKDIVAALLPCGHKMFCMECANRLCQQNEASCPVCSTQVKYYQSVRIHN